MGYSPCGHRDLDTTEPLTLSLFFLWTTISRLDLLFIKDKCTIILFWLGLLFIFKNFFGCTMQFAGS